MKGLQNFEPSDDDRSHKTIDSRLLLRLWSYLLPYKAPVVGCFGLTLAVAFLRLAQPVIVNRAIENHVMAGDMEGLTFMALIFLGVILLSLAFEITFNYATGVIGQRSMHDLRMSIFRHVNRLDVSFFDRTPVGRLITRMTSDVATLNDLFSSGVIAIIADMLMLSGLLVIMWIYSPRLTLVVACCIPFMYAIVMLFRRNSRKWFLEGRMRLAQVNAFLQENIAGMATVQSFNRERKNLKAFSGLNDEYRVSQIRTILAFSLFFPALNLVLYFTLASVIWVAGHDLLEARVLGGEPLPFGLLLLFVQCVNMMFTPMRQLSEKYNILQSAMASSARIFSLLDTEPSIKKPEKAAQPKHLQRSVAFENVSFDYVPGEPVLREVSFELQQGQMLAVVGATGSGKSTLVNLMMRFYDVNEGRITFDGVDIRDMDPHALRRQFAVVLQEVFLFSDTIAQNIRLTNPDLSDEEIWKLLRQVNAEDFVRELPEGIDTRVGERGASFSSGQKQLLAFARALAADPQILVLDEATANIDTATERRIQDAIAHMLEGRTALVIAHRISTIQRADRILVMHKGRIHESGTHQQLIARDGIYRRLYELQYRPDPVAEQAS